MLNKKIVMLTVILVSLFAVSAVCAADNATDDIVGVKTSEKVSLADDAANDVGAGESVGNFTELNSEIISKADGETLVLDKNYQYNLTDDKYDIRISKSITIDGNGNSIDGNNAASFFEIYGNNVTLKNIIFKNVKSDRAFIGWYGVNGTIVNCTFDGYNVDGDSPYSVILWASNAKNGVIENSRFLNGRDIESFISFSGTFGMISGCQFENSNSRAVGMYGDNFSVSNCSFKDVSERYLSVYADNGKINDLNLSNFISNAIMIYGSNIQFNRCVFMNYEGSSSNRGIIFSSGMNFTFNNSTFKNNKRTLIDILDYTSFVDCVIEDNTGKSIFTGRCSDIRFINNTFKNNNAMAVINIEGNHIFLSANRFIGNTVPISGLVNVAGNNSAISDCFFLNNSAKGSGGGINLNGNNNSIEKCHFINCHSYINGGAIYITGNNASVSDCQFENCSANQYGGSIAMINLDNASVSDCTFTSNSKVIYFDSVNHGVISGNTIYVTGNNQSTGIEAFKSNAEITNNEITSCGENAIFSSSSNLTVRYNGLTAEGGYGDGAIYDDYKSTIITEGNTRVKLNPNMKAVSDSKVNGTSFEMLVLISISLNETATGNVTVTLYGPNGSIIKRENLSIAEGNADFSYSGLADGEYNYTVDYVGDDNLKPASVNGTVIVKDPRSVPSLDAVAYAVLDADELVMVVYVNATTDAAGNLTFRLYDVDGSLLVSENVAIVEGNAVFIEPYLADGVYNYAVEYAENSDFRAVSVNGTVTVNDSRNITDLKADAEVSFDMNDLINIVTITVSADVTGNVAVTLYMADGTVEIAENVTVVNGKATFKEAFLSAGNYSYKVEFAGDAKNKENCTTGNITINRHATTIAPQGANVDYGLTYKVLVKIDGKSAGAGKEVTLKIAGKTLKAKTDKNGYATFTLAVAPKKYTATAALVNVADEFKASKNVKVTVKNVINAKNVKIKKSAKKAKIKVALKTSAKKPIAGKKLTLKIKGKKINAKTNKKGVATFNIKKSILKKLKAGKKYKYQVIYGKDTVKKTLKVKK